MFIKVSLPIRAPAGVWFLRREGVRFLIRSRVFADAKIHELREAGRI